MPSFEVMDQDGNMVKSSDFIGNGRKTIIYFYPKDNTSGCTAEACSFRDNYAALTAAGFSNTAYCYFDKDLTYLGTSSSSSAKYVRMLLGSQ